MITVLVDGELYRQAPATLANRAWAFNFARFDPRSIKIWETRGRKSSLVASYDRNTWAGAGFARRNDESTT